MSEPKEVLGYAGGIFVKMMTFERAGDAMPGHSHTYDHFTLLSRGRLRVEVNGKETEFVAPRLIPILRGLKHLLVALEDMTVVSCLHALHSREHPDCIIDHESVPKGVNPFAFSAPLTHEEIELIRKARLRR